MKIFVVIMFYVLIITPVLGKSYFYRSWGQKYEQGSSYFELGSLFWQSLKRVDLDGVAVDYPADQVFSHADIFFKYNYFFYPHLQLGLEGSGRYVKYTSASDSYSTSGFNNIDLIMRYFFPAEHGWHLGISFQYSQKLFHNSDMSSIPIDDDIGWMQADVLNSYYLSHNSLLNFSLGYRRFNELQSAELHYAIDYAYLGKKIDFYIGCVGVESTKQDVYTSDPTAKPPIGIYVTNLVNSINRRFLDAHMGIILKGSQWGIKLEGGSRFLGQSTDLGFFGLVSLVRTIKGKSSKVIKRAKFKEYDIEGEVTKVSPRGKYVKINIGLAKDLDTNMKVDIFKTDFFGGNVLIATGVIQELKASWSIIRITKKYSHLKIEKGFSARAY